ncbi:zinc finger protein 82-like isoform X2 [Hemicordylus capensis]|uniref:zinc finger protein 82-like isoform X2 n=1 Tax=Hemicordylus capensis TaxID=884348 RepID=UPI002304D01A|nr:zinc finger protein 82-like isoform X2 [Hemicordylus capensis]
MARRSSSNSAASARGRCRGAMAGGCGSKVPVRFEDVTVYFCKEEWKMLEEWQKELYWEVLEENYEALLLLGLPVTKSDILAWFEQGEHQNLKRMQASGVGDSSGISCTNKKLLQSCCKEYTEQVGSLRMFHGRCKEGMAQHGGGKGTEPWLVSSAHQGRSVRNKPLQHTEYREGTYGLNAHAISPRGAPKPYKCSVCGQKFRLKELLRIHQRASMKNVFCPCPECGMLFPSNSHLRMHQRIHNCTSTRNGRTSLVRAQLNRLQESQAEEKLLLCADCGENFSTYLSLLLHQKNHVQAKPQLCAQCGVIFMYQSDLEMHEESHLEEALCEYAACGKNCICECSLQLHFASRLRKCMENRETGGSQDHKPLHQGKHSKEEKPYSCDQCGLKFILEVNLEMHHRYHHELLLKRKLNYMKDVSFPCSECGIHFPSCSHLRMHQWAHIRELTDSESISLVHVHPSHLQGSQAKKLHLCASCGKSFSRYLGLLQHQKAHDEAKPQPCAQCGIIFMYQTDLEMHEENHLEEALCEYAACGKNCICECSLQLHFASNSGKHMGERESDSQGHQPLHQETHSEEEKPFLCCQCGLLFKLKVNLEAHYRYQHKELLLEHKLNGTFQTPLLFHWKFHANQEYKQSVPGSSRDDSWSSCSPSQVSCTDCGKWFASESRLHKHREKHKAKGHRGAAKNGKRVVFARGAGGSTMASVTKKLHKCQECGKKFVYKWQLISHLKGHTDEKCYQCPRCGKKIEHEASLREHCRKHAEEERAYQRDKQWESSSALADAVNDAEGKQLCQCGVCGRILSKGYLPDHWAFHSGLRYKCLLCGKICNFRSGASFHIKHHRKAGDFSACPKCRKKKNCLCIMERFYIDPGPQHRPGLEGTRPPSEGYPGK